MSKKAATRLIFAIATVLAAQAAALPAHAQIPIIGIISEAAKKTVMAIDLHIQQLQTETIGLQQAQKKG